MTRQNDSNPRAGATSATGNPLALLARAEASWRAGNLRDAIAFYQQILSADENNVIALTSLGTIQLQLGHREACLRLLGRSLEIKPDQHVALNNRSIALKDLGRLEEAMAGFERALALAPDYVSAHVNRGTVLQDLGRLEEALASFDRAVALMPANAQAHSNRGMALHGLKRLEEALASFDRALALSPGNAQIHINRGNLLVDMRRLDEAMASFDRSVALGPANPAAHMSRANLLRHFGRLDEALAANDRAMALGSGIAELHLSRGITLEQLDRHEEARASYDHAIALKPDGVDAYWNKSLLLLRLGEFTAGWELYERRWQAGVGTWPAYIRQPRWNGEKLPGALLAWGEQGLGDQIMFALLAPELMPHADRVALALDPRLVPLFKRAFPQLEVYPLDPELPVDRFGAQIALGSLGQILRKQLPDFPRAGPRLLKADEDRSRDLRRKIGADKKRIVGLSWRSKNEKVGRARSVTLETLLPVLSLPDVVWVDLQYDDTREERASLAAATGISLRKLDEVDNWRDIDGLAALIDACDLVVTIDNTTAHLAAALGKPTWILLPHVADFRWFRQREDSPWYPSVRLFRQPRAGDWPSVITRLGAALQEFHAA